MRLKERVLCGCDFGLRVVPCLGSRDWMILFLPVPVAIIAFPLLLYHVAGISIDAGTGAGAGVDADAACRRARRWSDGE